MQLVKNKILLSALSLLVLSSCGMFGKRSEEGAKHSTKQAKTEKVAAVQEPTTVAPAPTPKPEVTEQAQTIEKSVPPTIEPKAVENSTPVVPAETSLRWLKNGNTRFVKKNFRADGRSERDRLRLTNGQHPHAIVLSCSDSRVPPEIVFDQMLGEIFVIRVIGETLDSSVIASIEYAVEHLHSSLLVVMGHSQCGAIQATVKTPEGTSSGSSDIDKVLSDIRPRLASMKNEPASSNLEVEATLNADGVARDLVKRSAILQSAVEGGRLLIKPALYRVDSGKVTFY